MVFEEMTDEFWNQVNPPAGALQAAAIRREPALGLSGHPQHVHDSRWVFSTLVADPPQNLCLDKGYAYARVEQEVLDHTDSPHIRRIGEEKLREGEKTHPEPPREFRRLCGVSHAARADSVSGS
jgi:hypothetical protein